MVKEKRKSTYVLLALFAVLLGAGIQLALGYTAYRRESNQAQRLLLNLGEAARSAAVTELDRRAEEAASAASRLGTLPKEKQNARLGRDDSLLILVNPWNPLPEDYSPELADVGNRNQVDIRCAQALLQMLDDCRAAGYEPYICSAYRSHERQQYLFQNKVQRVVQEGHTWQEAPAIAATEVAFPGTSEHELGLAVDLIDYVYTKLDEKQEQTGTQIWLMENCWRYGFILRYPNGTTEITGIIYEPWHYRYVGPEYAAEITRMGLTLEEYLQLRQGR